jgi:ketosteroid isomerase-like protein
MFSWLAEKMIARNMEAIRAGDIKPTTMLYADDVSFSFPGDRRFSFRRLGNM